MKDLRKIPPHDLRGNHDNKKIHLANVIGMMNQDFIVFVRMRKMIDEVFNFIACDHEGICVNG